MRQSDGTWLRTQRAALGLTQVELAAALGLSSTHVAQMERGERRVLARTRLAVEALQRIETGRT